MPHLSAAAAAPSARISRCGLKKHFVFYFKVTTLYVYFCFVLLLG